MSYYHTQEEHNFEDRLRFHNRPECLVAAALQGIVLKDLFYNTNEGAPTKPSRCHVCDGVIPQNPPGDK